MVLATVPARITDDATMSASFVCALPEESAGLEGYVPVLHTGADKVQTAVTVAHHLAERLRGRLVLRCPTLDVNCVSDAALSWRDTVELASRRLTGWAYSRGLLG